MKFEFDNIGLGMIRKITDLWSGAKSDSYIDYTQVARVEPIVLIDTDCLYVEALPDIQQSLLSIFAGYYLQAVSISTTVGKIEVMRHLDKLNPKRNPGDSAANSLGWLLAEESYKFKLPKPSDLPALESYRNQVAMEVTSGDDPRNYYDDENNARADNKDARDQVKEDLEFLKNNREVEKAVRDVRQFDINEIQRNLENTSKAEKAILERQMFDHKRIQDYAARGMKESEIRARADEVKQTYELNKEKFGQDKAMALAQLDLAKAGLAINQAKLDDSRKASEVGFGKDTFTTLKELSNLSVGKQFSVEITDGIHKASILVSVRLMASSMPSTSLIRILAIGSQDNSVKERYHGWRSGRLEFVKDMIFCQDLIDAHRKNLMADKDSVYSNILKRSRGNQMATIMSGNPSVATASNLAIVSSETIGQLELQINGKISDFKTREKVFKATYLMIMVVVDKAWERVHIYHRGIAHSTEMGFKDLRSANKGSGPDVGEILKAYSIGNSPSL